MTDNSITNLINIVINNSKDLNTRLSYVTKSHSSPCHMLTDKLNELKKNLLYMNNLLDNINNSIDTIYANYGTINFNNPELILNNFNESQSDLSYSDDACHISNNEFNQLYNHKSK